MRGGLDGDDGLFLGIQQISRRSKQRHTDGLACWMAGWTQKQLFYFFLVNDQTINLRIHSLSGSFFFYFVRESTFGALFGLCKKKKKKGKHHVRNWTKPDGPDGQLSRLWG